MHELAKKKKYVTLIRKISQRNQIVCFIFDDLWYEWILTKRMHSLTYVYLFKNTFSSSSSTHTQKKHYKKQRKKILVGVGSLLGSDTHTHTFNATLT